ncbi:MAG: Flp family type IVb pilin [Symbiopectobacterium sp.]
MYFTKIMYNFKNDQRGVTAVEYAIVVAGVSAAVVSVIFVKVGLLEICCQASSPRSELQWRIL